MKRAKPEGVDQLLSELRKAADKQVVNLPGDESDAYDDIFDLAFASRVSGPSFKVVPIAVFAWVEVLSGEASAATSERDQYVPGLCRNDVLSVITSQQPG